MRLKDTILLTIPATIVGIALWLRYDDFTQLHIIVMPTAFLGMFWVHRVLAAYVDHLLTGRGFIERLKWRIRNNM